MPTGSHEVEGSNLEGKGGVLKVFQKSKELAIKGVAF
jgi:hypothetical protein